jgi:hypothetical protein
VHLQAKQRALKPKTQWSLQRLSEASLRDVGDGLHVPMVSPHRCRSIGELAGSAQPDGFEGRFFPPGLARRDHTAPASSLGSAGRSGSASNVRAEIDILGCGRSTLPFEGCARQAP